MMDVMIVDSSRMQLIAGVVVLVEDQFRIRVACSVTDAKDLGISVVTVHRKLVL